MRSRLCPCLRNASLLKTRPTTGGSLPRLDKADTLAKIKTYNGEVNEHGCTMSNRTLTAVVLKVNADFLVSMNYDI